MLHDPSHITPPEVAQEIQLEAYEIETLKNLAEQWATIASLPIHKERSGLWQKLNDLESERPGIQSLESTTVRIRRQA